MARSRSKRRRQNIGIVVAVALTATIITLAHDVNRLSAQSSANRASIDRNFAALATTLLSDEDRFGSSLATTLSSGPTASRAQFTNSLTALMDQGRALQQRAAILQHPEVSGGVQDTLIFVSDLRWSASKQLLETISARLALPGIAHASASLHSLGSKFRHADAMWASARRTFRRDSSHVRLPKSVFALSHAPLVAYVSALEASTSLAVQRSLSIEAVSVNPAPLPAAPGQWTLLATSPLSIGVSVRNQEYVDQNFVLHLSLTPLNGVAVQLQFAGRVGPNSSVATSFNSLVVIPSERANVKIWLTGTPIGPHAVGVRRYHVSVASSPTK